MTGPAQWSNHLWLTARCYEPLWRRRSVAILTGGAFDTQRELAAMIAHVDLDPGSAVVDLGCSAGLYARHLAGAGMEVTAVDVSRAFLREGERLATREGREVRFVLADVAALPFPDGSFAGAVCGGSLNEFVDAPRALREAGRVLADGAPLWLMYLARSETFAGRALQAVVRATGLRFPEPGLVDAWALDAGFTPERSERRGPLVLARYRRGGGLPPLSTTSPSPGWDGPRPRPRRERRVDGQRLRAVGQPLRGSVVRPERPSRTSNTAPARRRLTVTKS